MFFKLKVQFLASLKFKPLCRFILKLSNLINFTSVVQSLKLSKKNISLKLFVLSNLKFSNGKLFFSVKNQQYNIFLLQYLLISIFILFKAYPL